KDRNGELLIDGRNRLRACEIAGVEPQFTYLNGEDQTAFIFSANLRRRDLTASQKAIVIAKASVTNCNVNWTARQSAIAAARICEAITVRRYAPGLADDVLAKKLRLDQAVIEARRLKALAETNEEKWAKIRAEAPEFVDAGISLEEAEQKAETRRVENVKL